MSNTDEQLQRDTKEQEHRLLREEVARLSEQNVQLQNFILQGGFAPNLSAQNSAASFASPVTNHGHASASPMSSRSKSTMGHYSSMIGSRSTGQNRSDRMALHQRGRAQSHQQMSAPSMSRTGSSRSGSSIPFKSQGARIEPLPNNPRRTSAPQPDLVHHRQLPDVQEDDVLPGVGMRPDLYLANQPDYGTYLDSTRTNMPVLDAFTLSNFEGPPSMCSGSSAPDVAIPITRENSLQHGPTAMIKDWSSQSRLADPVHSQDMLAVPSMEGSINPGHKHPVTEEVLLGFGASMQVSPTYNGMFLSPSLMERTDSNSTTDSAASAKSNASAQSIRCKQRTQEVIKNSQTIRIEPKQPVFPTVSHQAPRKPQVSISKSTYQRPRHARVFCDKCDEHPEGFRGEHEFQRHAHSKHSPVTTKFVCSDPATRGLHSALKPKVPLAGCKSCDTGKFYNAYYNAAAHLRRWHFNPKDGRPKHKVTKGERRGGKAGGSWPIMEDLKLWFETRTVRVEDLGLPSQLKAQDEEDEENDYQGVMDQDAMDSSSMNASSVSFSVSETLSLPSAGDAPLVSPTQVSPSGEMLDPALSMGMMSSSFFEGDYGASMDSMDSDMSNDVNIMTFDMNSGSMPNAFDGFN